MNYVFFIDVTGFFHPYRFSIDCTYSICDAYHISIDSNNSIMMVLTVFLAPSSSLLRRLLKFIFLLQKK